MGALSPLVRRLERAPVRRPPIAFVVVGRSRTGSRWLVDMLDAHPRLRCHGELFADAPEAEIDALCARWRARAAPWVRAAGCKVFHHHPAAGQESRLWTLLERDTTVRVIHLRRRDVLASLVSRKVAGETDTWKRHAGDPATTRRVRMSPDEVERGLRIEREWAQACDARFAKHPLLALTYEELVADTRASLERVHRFLGVRPAAARSRFVRQTTAPASEYLVNWPELRAHFAGSEWAPYFR
jgi:LPS sulfotransferase NodH